MFIWSVHISALLSQLLSCNNTSFCFGYLGVWPLTPGGQKVWLRAEGPEVLLMASLANHMLQYEEGWGKGCVLGFILSFCVFQIFGVNKNPLFEFNTCAAVLFGP